MDNIKVVLAGPPRSGKSCMREGLKQAIRAIPGAPYPYVITACPDGEGAWFQETVNQNPELAAACKAAYKAKFTPEFVERIKTSVEKCPLELTLVDIGGIISAYYGTEDKVEGIGQDGVLRGSVHHLERGESVAERPMVRLSPSFWWRGRYNIICQATSDKNTINMPFEGGKWRKRS